LSKIVGVVNNTHIGDTEDGAVELLILSLENILKTISKFKK